MANPTVILTYSEIESQEPALKDIMHRASHDRRRNRTKVYESYKTELLPLVGYHSTKEELRTEEAYDKALEALCTALKY